MSDADDPVPPQRPVGRRSREHRRRRFRRRRRHAYIRSVYFLPSLATLGNALCGFAAMYVASLPAHTTPQEDWVTVFFAMHRFIAACYLIFFAMVFDALDGRLARFTRHTTEFGGQLDSLADVISFGVAPAFLALLAFKDAHPALPPPFDRLCWAIGALYVGCAAVRLAKFNVSNELGEQHHFSFLGLPSPGAAGAVVGFVLMQQDLAGNPLHGSQVEIAHSIAAGCTWAIPPIVLICALLMVSNLRYPHMINRYLRGRRSLQRLIGVMMLLLLFVVAHRLFLGIVALAYAMWGPISYLWFRAHRRSMQKQNVLSLAKPPQ